MKFAFILGKNHPLSIAEKRHFFIREIHALEKV